MKTSNKKIILFSLGAGIILGCVFAGASVFAKVYYHGRFPSNTSLAGIDISYKTITEGNGLVETKVADFQKEKIEISYKEQSHKFTLEELGVNILLSKTLGLLEKNDASELSVTDFLPTPGNFIEKKHNILVEVDEEKLLKTLDETFHFTELEGKSAAFYFNEEGDLAISEEKDGEAINKQEIVASLEDVAGNLATKDIKITTNFQKPVTKKEDLEKQRPKIEEILNKKITLIDPIYSGDYDFYLRDHLDWLEFVTSQKIKVPYLKEMTVTGEIPQNLPGEKTVTLAIKKSALDTYVDTEISRWLDRPTEDVKIYMGTNGEIIAEGKGVNGRKVQRNSLKQAIELALANDITEIPIPVIDVPANYKIDAEVQKMGIKERISQGHTSYYGSPTNRLHNIKTGATRFDGVIIQPGQEFSFNTTLGIVDGSTGYRKELVIKPEGTLPEFGGGLCQVSTTMYRAILFAGLPVTDRAPHSYAVSYYSQVLGHGLDATIYLGGQDLKFTNDTGYPILVHTYTVDDYELYFDFYGTADGRSVELEGPKIYGHTKSGPTEYIETDQVAPGQTKQVEKAHNGFSADWLYYLTDASGKTTTQTLHSVYRAVPNKIWVGRGEAPESAATGPAPAPTQEFATP